MQTVGEKLKALRARTPHTVRSVAEYLKFENHSRYAYYESKRFKDWLPIDMARDLSKLFVRSGKVEPNEVLELAGLSADEATAQGRELLYAIKPDRVQTIELAVQMPSDKVLTEMFVGMLEALGQQHLSAELAEPLARLLPTALQAAPTGHGAVERARDPKTSVATLLQEIARSDLGLP